MNDSMSCEYDVKKWCSTKLRHKDTSWWVQQRLEFSVKGIIFSGNVIVRASNKQDRRMVDTGLEVGGQF